MKVILTQELRGRGGEGDVIDVARGFAVNYLLPRQIAIEASPGNLKQLEQRMHNIKKREDLRTGDAQALAAALDGKVVTIGAKVGEEGRLFGSVTALMVHEAILDQLGVDIDRRKIETHGAIKEIGPRVVDVAIYRDVKAQVTVEVVAEGAIVAEAAPAAVAEDEDAGVEVDTEADIATDEAEAVVEADESADSAEEDSQ